MATNGKTVLLVEDNEDNRIVYSTILRHFGYEVSEALNGEEGIAKARAERPDLILMDISIPIIDGWEATQVLKHDPLSEADATDTRKVGLFETTDQFGRILPLLSTAENTIDITFLGVPPCDLAEPAEFAPV